MRGIAYDRFGDEDVLRVRDDLPEPPAGPDTVLVRVHAAGVNPVDMAIRAGYLAGAFPHHFPIIPGWDVSGVVERVDLAGEDAYAFIRLDASPTVAARVAASGRPSVGDRVNVSVAWSDVHVFDVASGARVTRP